MSSMAHETSPAMPALGWIDRLGRRILMQQLASIRGGEVVLHDAGGSTQFGESDELQATCQVNNSKFFRRAMLGGTNSVAESYINGEWDCDDLTALFRIFVRNLEVGDGMDRGLARIGGIVHKLYHLFRGNHRAGSRRNISDHYDLGNEFFQLWLDDTLAYSCGIFPSANSTLREASIEKFRRVCRQLSLHASDHLLEIGTGWGGFAMHAASEYGCQVTTTTISDQQFSLANERIQNAGLANKIQVIKQDYRDLTGQYDKLVSIEMIEAIGHKHFDTYFRKCSSLLSPQGSMLLQAIVIPERRYESHLRTVDFMQRYIFPGGCLPSVGAMMDSVGRNTDLRLVHVEDFAPHYAETLRRWRRAFQDRLPEVRQLGYTEKFIRLWNYYLCYCEAVFEERYVGVVQMKLDKPQCRQGEIPRETRAKLFSPNERATNFASANS